MALVAVAVGAAAIGCGSSLNPAFVNLLDPSGSRATLENAPGHVIVSVINNATLDESLLNYLELEGGLDVSDAQSQELRPRIRFRAQITFSDGSVQTVEFITGTPNLVDQRFADTATADLNQNDLDNVVVRCDVASVTAEPGAQIDVFVPVEITSYQQTQVTNPEGGVDIVYQPRQRTQPQFTPLLVDEVDEDGNVILQRNAGIRDLASPVLSPQCGAVIAIVITGTLTVPFLPEAGTNDPSYDVDDAPTEASIGGRYEFAASVQ
jgi:hypothetical protein